MNNWEGINLPTFDSMRIKNLFGSRDEVIEFEKGDCLKVIYGQNGSGKSTVLHILEAFLNMDFVSLMRLPFESLEIRATRRSKRDAFYGFWNNEVDKNILKFCEDLLECEIPNSEPFENDVVNIFFDDGDIDEIRLPNCNYFLDKQQVTITKISNGSIRFKNEVLSKNVTIDKAYETNDNRLFRIEESIERTVYTEDSITSKLIHYLKEFDMNSDDNFNTLGGKRNRTEVVRMLSRLDLTDENWFAIKEQHEPNFQIVKKSSLRYEIDDESMYDPNVDITDKSGEHINIQEFLDTYLDYDLYRNIPLRYDGDYLSSTHKSKFSHFSNLEKTTEYHKSTILNNFLLTYDHIGRINQDLNNRYRTQEPIKSQVNLVFLSASRYLGSSTMNEISDLTKFADSIESRYENAISFLSSQIDIIEDLLEKYGDISQKLKLYDKYNTQDQKQFGSYVREEESWENTNMYLELISSEVERFEDKFDICSPKLTKAIESLKLKSCKFNDVFSNTVDLNLIDMGLSMEKMFIAVSDLTSFWIVTEVLSSHFEKEIILDSYGKLRIVNHLGEKLPTYSLSSGEKQLIFLYWKILSSMKRKNEVNENVVIIDEPELSLHLSWQRNFLDNVVDILTSQKKFGEEMAGGYDVKLLVATHSPSILSNHYDLSYELGFTDVA